MQYISLKDQIGVLVISQSMYKFVVHIYYGVQGVVDVANAKHLLKIISIFLFVCPTKPLDLFGREVCFRPH